ncbi:MAG: hypothetical protein JSV43_05995, partial [Methanobacteriota archaeon]
MEEDDKKKVYAKGYEDGLKDAWKSVVQLTTRGHSVQELRMIAKGNIVAVPQKTSEKVSRLDVSRLIPEEPISEYKLTRPLEEGRSYIVKERRPDRSFLIFLDIVVKGAQGLCVARIHPEELKEKYG